MEEQAAAVSDAVEELENESNGQADGLVAVTLSAGGSDDDVEDDECQGNLASWDAEEHSHFEATGVTGSTILNTHDSAEAGCSSSDTDNDKNDDDSSDSQNSSITSLGSRSSASSNSENSVSMGFSGVENFGKATQERAPGLELSQGGRGHGRGGPGRGASGTGVTRRLSGGDLPPARQAPARISREARLPGSGGGRGRGLGPKTGTLADVNDETSAPRPLNLMARSASERFTFKPEWVDQDEILDVFKKKRKVERSRSMNLSTDGSVQSGDALEARNTRFAMNSLNRYSVAFGASREQHHYQPKVIRRSQKMDIQTGGVTAREVICQRIIDYPEAMNPAERRRKTVVRRGLKNRNARESTHGKVTILEPQYRLHCKVQTTTLGEQIQTETVTPGPLTSYLIWSLRANFPIVLLSETLAFWTLCFVFACLIYLGALLSPQCLTLPNGKNWEEGGSYFMDTFALSWTTFATVGYGVVNPTIRPDPDSAIPLDCSYMTTISALNSFVGVLFASFCGAVIVGKMTRAKSTAAVRFSERMIIRFGTGVMHTDDDDDRLDDRLEKPVTDSERRRILYPCPVLEFRLANCLFGNTTGEILNSKISVVGNTRDDKRPEQNTVNGRPRIATLRRVVTATQFLRGSRGLSESNHSDASEGDACNGHVVTPNNGRARFRRASFFVPTTKTAETESSETTTVAGSDDVDSSSRTGPRLRAIATASQFLRKQAPRHCESDPQGLSTRREQTTESDATAPNHGITRPRRTSLMWPMSKATEIATDTTAAGSDGIYSSAIGKEAKKEKIRVLRKLPTLEGVMKTRIMRSVTPNWEQHDPPPESNLRKNAICVEEDPTGGLMPRSLYSNVNVECDTHPFLKRVWTIRHVLNADSPLLSETAVRIIKESKGLWPADACNFEFIRANVDFQQLIVSLSGTKTGIKVYGLHLYDHRNLHVGYAFSPILQSAQDGRLEVDLDNIDSVREQRGGGAEPIDYYVTKMRRDDAAPKEGEELGPPMASQSSFEQEGPSLMLTSEMVNRGIVEEHSEDSSIESF